MLRKKDPNWNYRSMTRPVGEFCAINMRRTFVQLFHKFDTSIANITSRKETPVGIKVEPKFTSWTRSPEESAV